MASATKTKTTKPRTPTEAPIPQPKTPPPGRTEARVRLDDIIIDREHIGERLVDDAEIRHLAASLAQQGQLMPIGVQPADKAGKHRLVWGRRRVEAARILKWTDIGAMVFTSPLNEAQVLEARESENVQRLNLNPTEEALAVVRLVEMYENDELERDRDGTTYPTHAEPGRNAQMTAAAAKALRSAAVGRAAERLAKPEQWVRDRLFLARLDGAARDLVMSGALPLGHAREIAKLADPKLRSDLAKRAAADSRSGLPMRLDHVREEVRRNLLSLAQVPWKLDAAFDGKPACVECPHNSANVPGLFDHHTEFSADRSRARLSHAGTKGAEPAAGVCTLAVCFAGKSAAANAKARSARDKVVRQVREGKGKVKPSAALVESVATPWIRPAVVQGLVAEELKKTPAKKEKGKKSGARQHEYVPYHDTPQGRADGLARNARETWLKAHAEKIAAAVNAQPGRWALLQLIRGTRTFQATQHHEESKARKAAASPELKRLLALLVAPDWECVLACEKASGTKHGVVGDYREFHSGVTRDIATVLGIDTTPIPTKEEFLAEAKRILDAEKAKKAGGKSGAKAKSARAEVLSEDNEDLE